MKPASRCFVVAMLVLAMSALALAQISPPTHLQGAYFHGRVVLGWEPPESDIHASSYHVYRTDNGGSTFSLLATFPASYFPFYVDSSVVVNGDYHYYVTASGAPPDSAESGPSNTVDVQTVFRPAPPQELTGWTDSAGAELAWERPWNHDSVSTYNVHRWTVADTVPQVVGSTPERHFTDGSFNPAIRSFYFVTAVYAQDTTESWPSNVVILPHFRTSIMFTSTPVKLGAVGQLYQYQAATTTNPPGHKVCYSLDEAPDGMTIDSTGLVTWTPGHGGEFEVSIRAVICDSGFGAAKQEYDLLILNGPPGSVSGTVRNQHGDPVPHVRLKLFDVHSGDFVLRAGSDSTGHYSFPIVDPSTYFLRAIPDTGSGYAPQWYNGVFRIADATPIDVPESTSVTIDVTLTPPPPPPPKYLLTGTVWDDASTPLGHAHVEVFPARHDSGSWHIDGEHDDCNPVRDAGTDSSGHFAFVLPAGDYIVEAEHRGFYPQFFDHKATPLEATVITLSGDNSTVNFNLHPIVHGHGMITGTIFDRSDSSHIRSFVAGFHRPAADSAFDGFIAYGRTDTSGGYELSGLIDGYYIVLALPREDFIPTFYSTSGGTAYHDSATAVQIAAGDSVGGIDIYAIPDSADGLNTIAGVVEEQGGNAISAASAVPVTGALVTVANQQTGAVVGTAITDATGAYTVTGLAPADYKVTFQKPGSTTTTANVSLAYANNTPATATLNAQMSSWIGGGLGTMSVAGHWNLLSLPVSVGDAQLTSVFPAAISSAFRYDGTGYVTSSVLDYTSGYWLRFSAATVFTIAGSARNLQQVPITAGWNLIGSISSPVATATVATTPPNILGSEFFGYGNGYFIASSIQPGQGYWVEATANGSLTLSGSSASSKAGPAATASLSALGSLTLKDNTGGAQTLYIGPADGSIAVSRYAMPPLPPSDAFDARFASQRMVETFDPALHAAALYPIALHTSAPSVIVQWNLADQAHRYLLVDDKGAVIAKLRGTGSTTVPSTRQMAVRVDGADIPKEFALGQNYPNPFNPSTSVAFSLPSSSIVTLTIYNLLGQEVSSPIRGRRYDAGSYQVTIDGSGMTSGVYFYRLQAGAFSGVRKMLLIK